MCQLELEERMEYGMVDKRHAPLQLGAVQQDLLCRKFIRALVISLVSSHVAQLVGSSDRTHES